MTTLPSPNVGDQSAGFELLWQINAAGFFTGLPGVLLPRGRLWEGREAVSDIVLRGGEARTQYSQQFLAMH